jgi:hypothetical protein
MESGYDRVAREIGHSCEECPDNCCDSWFQHHTYSEWAYLWQGIRLLEDLQIDQITRRARAYLEESQILLARGETPRLMCPLNERGRCFLYEHRLMICRLHGVPATMTRPDGKLLSFPGCHVCQEMVEKKYGDPRESPFMDRTDLFRRLAALENEVLEGQRHLYPRVKLTIAEMIVKGPPRVPHSPCEQRP